jgi:asparagine synthase (glutamine-hydrolysing)
MCGIAGLLGPRARDDLASVLDRMTDALVHRGPDARGTFVEEAGTDLHCGLGHRRLSILDLSSAGAQPMASRCGRYVLSFNGEIYNHLRLRAELEGPWRGTSDTETLLAGIARWGLEGTLARASGMFAIALWDRRERRLFLARDRLGEKPLYYARARDGAFLFASELKAVRADPFFDAAVDPDALDWFLTLGYVPAPLAIYRTARKLPPGTWLEVRGDGTHAAPVRYWDLAEIARRGLEQADARVEDEIEATLRTVVREQRIADVPLGCFLSGGVDSSLVAALLAEEKGPRLRTFSIGFGEGGFDESSFARDVAARLGTDHTELRATPADALALVPRLPHPYDEPFADASQLPSLLPARLARPHVTVALTGDGGDEIFAGYNRYLFLERARRLPRAAAPALAAVSRLAATGAFRTLERIARVPQLDEKLRKVSEVASADTDSDAYWRLAAQGLREPRAYPEVERIAAGVRGVPGLQLRDQLLYLPDDILVKVDRAAMAASLETRAPFLDHRVVELAWRLPLSRRTEGRTGKLVLRRLLARRLDPGLWARPKAGFTPPLGAWLTGSLRDWADDLLSDAGLARTALPGGARVREEWLRVREHGGNGALRLWPALMAQAWLKES